MRFDVPDPFGYRFRLTYTFRNKNRTKFILPQKIIYMITRFWHGRTKSTDTEIYREYVMNTGIFDLTSTNGNLGAQIWQQTEKAITHIWVVSWWDNYESIKAFAGDDIEIARYYEEDKKYLLELEPTVQHYNAYDFKAVS